MKKFYTTLFILASISSVTIAQEWKDVAAIFYARCGSCHNPNGHPVQKLTTYSGAVPHIIDIATQLNNNTMPPWTPDTNYTRFTHERTIGPGEKQAILDWITNGAQQGDTTLAPPVPNYPQFQLYGTPDLILQIPTFASNATSTSDAYNCFSVPSGLLQNRILRAFEIVPGNASIVHHVVVNIDTTATVPSDLSGSCFSQGGQFSIGGYAPGAAPTVFPGSAPLKAGITIKAGSNFILQLHYPAGTQGQLDSTTIRLYFYPLNTTGVRTIYSTVPLQNWNLLIPANTTQTFTAKYPSGNSTLPVALSIYSCFPHSHKVCKSITNYAYTPTDTIPLIRMNNWDFNWQGYFTFNNLVKVPAGYKFWSDHLFDNTTNNPNTPNPVLVTAGFSTSDEMLFDGFQYLLYQPGDEFINIDSLLEIDPLLNGIAPPQTHENLHSFAFPNPFANKVNISYTLDSPCEVNISIYNMYGALVKTIHNGMQSTGVSTTEWDGTNIAGAELSSGMYFYKISAGASLAGGKLTLMRKK